MSIYSLENLNICPEKFNYFSGQKKRKILNIFLPYFIFHYTTTCAFFLLSIGGGTNGLYESPSKTSTSTVLVKTSV